MDALAAIAIFAAKTAVNVQDTALQRLFRIQAIEENTCPVSVPLDLRLFLSRTAASNRAWEELLFVQEKSTPIWVAIKARSFASFRTHC